MVTASADAHTVDFFEPEEVTDAAREGTEARRKAPLCAWNSEEAETALGACVDRRRRGRREDVGQAEAGLGLGRVRPRRRRIACGVGGRRRG